MPPFVGVRRQIWHSLREAQYPNFRHQSVSQFGAGEPVLDLRSFKYLTVWINS